MRIAVHTPSIPSDPGQPSGAAAATETLAAALSIAGHEPIRPGMSPANGDRGTQGSLAGPASLAGQRPDLWMTYGLRDSAPDLAGPAVAKELGIPYVLIDPRGSESDKEAAQALAAADAVVPLSDASMRWVTALRPDVPTTRLLPFIDPGPYDSVRRLHGHQSASIAMRHGLDSDAPHLLCVSAMRHGDKLKSYEILVRALSRLAMTKWQLIVVGDGPARAEIEALLRRLPLGRVRLAGSLTNEELVPYYAMSDLLVAPSVGGTHGRVLLEAQATGLPVVACDGPGVRDAVHDGMTGRLCPEGNAESLSQAILFLLRERNFLTSFAAATTHAIGKDHHIGSAAAQLGEFLAGFSRSKS